tara:strand:+ start:450 stop:932 length:483 start_codon:yes stop_codon:yes gene_type:complete
MATTTAALTISSSDLVGDALSLTTTNTLYKAGTTTGLDQTTGMTKVYLTSASAIDLFPALVEGSIAFTGKTSWVYICNKSEDESEYALITIGGINIGRLYGGPNGTGDYLWMPWSMKESVNADNHHGDIEIAPSVATGMWFEWTCINEGTEWHAADLAIS